MGTSLHTSIQLLSRRADGPYHCQHDMYIYVCVCLYARPLMGLPRFDCIGQAGKLWLRGHMWPVTLFNLATWRNDISSVWAIKHQLKVNIVGFHKQIFCFNCHCVCVSCFIFKASLFSCLEFFSLCLFLAVYHLCLVVSLDLDCSHLSSHSLLIVLVSLCLCCIIVFCLGLCHAAPAVVFLP